MFQEKRCGASTRAISFVFFSLMAQPGVAGVGEWEAQMRSGLDHVRSGNHHEAATSFTAALKEAESIGELTEFVALSLNNLGMQHLSLGNYADAQKLLGRSLSIRKAIGGENHPLVGTTLNNLATLHLAQGDYAQAESLFKDSVEFAERVYGLNHSQVATSLNNLATLYSAQSRNAAAEAVLKRAMAIFEMAGDNRGLAQATENLRLLYVRMGRTDEAKQLRESRQLPAQVQSDSVVQSRGVVQPVRVTPR